MLPGTSSEMMGDDDLRSQLSTPSVARNRLGIYRISRLQLHLLNH